MFWGWALYLVIAFFTSMSKKTSAGDLLAYYWKITGNYRPLLILNILMVAVASGLGVLLTNVLGGFIDILATNQVYSPEIIAQGWQHLYFTIGLMAAVFILWKNICHLYFCFLFLL
jgi:branched-subunit amino acid ABC-type transport system permease component